MTSDESVRSVALLLHSRGRECTPDQVRVWVDKMRVDMEKKVYKKPVIDKETYLQRLCAAVLKNEPQFTMLLHLHFGDSL